MTHGKDTIMYHIQLAPGECSEQIVLVGDPARPLLASKLFDEVTQHRAHREFVSYRGKYRGMDVTVLSTGIGPDNTEIVLAEIFQITKSPTIIRAGSCGSIQGHIKAGDLVISSAAMRLENTTLAYAPLGYPAISDFHVIQALVKACQKLGLKHHVGITATAPGFYAPQGRAFPKFETANLQLIEYLQRLGILNLEMESSVIFTLSQVMGARAGAICAVFADRVRDIFLTAEERRMAELACVRAALEAHVILAAQ